MTVLRRSLLPLAFVASLSAGCLSAAAQNDPQNSPAPAPQSAPADSVPSMPAATPARPSGVAPAPVPASSIPSVPTDANRTPAQSQPAQTPPVPAKAASLPSLPPYDYDEPVGDHLGSTYIPDDSPVYPMAMRLYSMGYLNKAVISMRPWTRRSLLHILDDAEDDITTEGDPEALAIFARLKEYIADEAPGNGADRGVVYGIDTGYTRVMGITGTTLRDSYHLGQTIVNDYGRPYAHGFNNVTGFSSVNEAGRFSLYVRGEYQHAPAWAGYSLATASTLSCTDYICPFVPPNNPQATIPYGNTGAQNPFRIVEATLSYHVLGHEISFGKQDSWMGPAQGGAMAWSNNAENIYAFRLNRVEPLNIPGFSWLFGTLRYDFFVGSLKGHTYPNDPWVHSEQFALRPTDNFEFSFQRTVIWGGKGHEPINLHSFLRSFFSLDDTESDPNSKNSAADPGARYSDFSFSWRLPYLRHYVTLYTDSIAHDDVTPISAPRRAAYRPGVYISQFPGMKKLDFRVEAVSTDTSTLRSLLGQFNYYEGVQKQGYTNKGFIMGDWIGREAKGGQAWLTWHISPDEFVQVEYLNKKTPKDFIPGGTTQNQFKVEVEKRLRPELLLDAWYQWERFKAPVAYNGPQSDNVFAAQFTWYPRLKTANSLNGK